ncbi:MAG: hypothetical protein WHV26_11900 [Spirochaetota bacterium]
MVLVLYEPRYKPGTGQRFAAFHYTALSARCGVINGREAKTNVQRSVK